MKKLNFELKELCRKNRDGSFSTQASRFKLLQKIADDLLCMGYKHMVAESLKEKHVVALVNKYLAEELSISTIKNRMAAVRWWADKVDKYHISKKDNDYFGIPDREYVSDTSKAVILETAKLPLVKDLHVRMSMELQKAFGLRREEAIKFIPAYADRGDKLVLKSTWTKGGKEREIPILNQAQRELLNRARMLAGNGSLIPPSRNYIQQLRIYEKQTNQAGFSKLHGLRHHYAQQRYEELTGWKSPHAGGLDRNQLNPEQKIKDHRARMQISKELGHERLAIVSVYLGC